MQGKETRTVMSRSICTEIVLYTPDAPSGSSLHHSSKHSEKSSYLAHIISKWHVVHANEPVLTSTYAPRAVSQAAAQNGNVHIFGSLVVDFDFGSASLLYSHSRPTCWTWWYSIVVPPTRRVQLQASIMRTLKRVQSHTGKSQATSVYKNIVL